MKLHLTLNDIDYKSLISFANENAGYLFGFLGLDNLNAIAVKAINGGQLLLIRKLQKMCMERNVNIRLNGIHAEIINSNDIKLTADVEGIDIEAIASLILPLLQKRLMTDSHLSFLADTINTHPEAFTSALSSFIEHLNKEEQEKLIVSAINALNSKIMNAAETFARDKKLIFKFIALRAE